MYAKTDEAVELKVSGKTTPQKLGGAIAKYLKEVPSVYLTAMGETAVNAAVKGIIVAQSYLALEAHELDIKFGFDLRNDEQLGKEVTIVVFYVKYATR